jgi:sec-independent protein translocase protein TatA
LLSYSDFETPKENAMFGHLGVPELLIILLIVIIIFGASRLPQLGKGLGQGLKNFKDSVRPEDREKTPPGPSP